MLPRTLEPEVMDTAEEAADYDAMDHSTVNRVFVGDFVAAVSGQVSAVRKEEVGDRRSEDEHEHSTLDSGHWTLLDVGTGTALIPIELVRFVCESGDLRSGQRRGHETGRNEETGRNAGPLPLDPHPLTLDPHPLPLDPLHITAIDLAEEMLKLGRANVERAGCSDCITLELVDAKGLPYPDGAFDAVMSNSIVHHIPEPRGTLAEMWRVLRPGGLLFVRDLLRPETSEEVERIVATYAGNESPRQQQLFRQSLHAALTVSEVGDMLAEIGLQRECVRQTSDRHWTIVARR